MRPAAFTVAVLALAALPALPAGPAAHACSISCSGFGQYAHWAERCDPRDVRLGITTEGGEVSLLLTDNDVVFQLSDRTMRKVHRELRDARDEDGESPLVYAFVVAVTSTVREVLDHSVRVHMSDLSDVRYEHGRLMFIGNSGRVILGRAHVGDSDVSRAFSEESGQRFVREFRRLKNEMM